MLDRTRFLAASLPPLADAAGGEVADAEAEG